MALLAAHLNDAAITVLSAEQLLYREPGYALLDDGSIETGIAAERVARRKPRQIHNRYWRELSTEPLGISRFEQVSAAELVSRQLEAMWSAVAQPGDELLVAVPPTLAREQLALLLGIAQDLGIPIAALVDAAAAATRREYRDAVVVHIDIGLHHVSITRLQQNAQALVEKSEIIESAGIVPLSDAWTRKISDAFVKQSRFDPLHTAETEQTLADTLPEWLAQAVRSDKVTMTIEYHGIAHEAQLESLDLVSAAAPVYQRIAGQLRALLRADETPAIQLTDRAARMPGLADMLTARVGGELFLLEPGATARGLLARAKPTGASSLVRALPWDQTAIDVAVPDAAEGGAIPTHLLFENDAYRVGDSPLVLGSQPDGGDGRWIDFGRAMPGLSRRHCTVTKRKGQCVVEDHSRYGTFLNGHRIEGSVVLQSGDLLRVGTPGFELRLIRAED